MSFKIALYLVLCLVLTSVGVMMRLQRRKTLAAQEEAKINALNTFLRDSFAHSEQVIAEIDRYRANQKNFANMIEKFDHATNAQKIPEYIKNLRNINKTLLADDFPSSCTTLKNNATGTYYIKPVGAVEPFLVRCDFEDNFNLGGGWTVFQHRYDGSVDFYRNWTMYKNGFGDVKYEHWLGLEKLHLMTKSGKHELLIILGGFDGETAYAHYKEFEIGSEREKFKLTVGSYSGTARDSLQIHNGMTFSTFDQDNDTDNSSNCAEEFRGGWWFFYYCFISNLNGEYQKKGEHVTVDFRGVKWDHWKGSKYSLKSTKMMLRRRSG